MRILFDHGTPSLTTAPLAALLALLWVTPSLKRGLSGPASRRNDGAESMRPAVPPRRKISEVLALMPKHSTATMDGDFARDVHSAIESHREPLEPPAWD